MEGLVGVDEMGMEKSPLSLSVNVVAYYERDSDCDSAFCLEEEVSTKNVVIKCL